MKKKSKDDPSNVSPRELARYAVVNLMDGIFSDPIENDSKESLRPCQTDFKKYLKELDANGYIEYLEQMFIEAEFQWLKQYMEAGILAIDIYLVCLNLRQIYSQEEISRHKKSRNAAMKTVEQVDYMFSDSKYLETGLICGRLTRDTMK